MSDVPQGPGWWQASDGRWYPPSPSPPSPSPPSPGPPSDSTGVPLWTPPPGPQAPPGPPGPPGAGSTPGPYQVYRTPMPGQTPTGLPDVQGMAVASLVLGICGLASCLFCAIGLVLSLVGLPLGIVSLLRITRGQADPRSKGLAIAGVVTNAIALVLAILVAVLITVGASIDTSTM